VRTRSLILSSILLASPIVGAQEVADEQDNKRFSYRVGAQLFTSYSSTLRIDSEILGRGTEFTLENDLNVEQNFEILRLDGVYRFGRRHAVAASFYDIHRTGNRRISRDIKIGDEVFPVNTVVESSFDQDVLKLAYRYQFMNRPKLDMSASFGLHTMQLEHSVRSANGALAQSNSADAPLPVLGIHGSYRFAPKWRFIGSAEWFDVQTGDLQGTFLDAIVSVEHDTFENFGFGFGFNRLKLDLAAGDENLRGQLEITFDAALIYVKGGFGAR
jgi:hypothetical protein